MKNTLLLLSRGIFLLLILPLCYSSKGQRQNDYWIFGSSAGINWSAGNSAFRPSNFFSLESCASVCDPVTGQLLFYSNGQEIYDRNFNPLQNGDNLKGNLSSTQGTLILPRPGKPGQYLLFTTPEATNTSLFGLHYSVIDMSLNGGLGAVPANEKNILLLDEVVEGLTYCFNRDSSAYWLITHERGSNRFVTFEINEAGIGKNKVFSPAGRIFKTYADHMGYFKVSPDGTRLAFSNTLKPNATYTYSQIELYTIDECGRIREDMVIGNVPLSTYGCEFSPNGRFLYFSGIESPSRLFQADLSLQNAAAVESSITEIGRATPIPNQFYYYGGLQRRGNKIYLAQSYFTALHCIEFPDLPGAACQFRESALILMDGSFSRYGLPQMVPGPLLPARTDTSQVKINRADSCRSDSLRLSMQGLSSADSVQWTIVNQKGDTLYITGDTAIFATPDTGLYQAELRVFKACRTYLAYATIRLYDCKCLVSLNISDSCLEDDLVARLSGPVLAVKWVLREASGEVADSSVSALYRWQVPVAGIYRLTATYTTRCGDDSLVWEGAIDSCPSCIWWIPNSFSPNGNTWNEVFKPQNDCAPERYLCRIYSRWGEEIFFTEDYQTAWDGHYRGKLCPVGAYAYILQFQMPGGAFQQRSGTIQLLR